MLDSGCAFVRSIAGSCGALEIRWGRGRRVFSGLAVVGKSGGLNALIGARAVFFIVDLCSTTFPLLAENFCVSFYRRRLRVLPLSLTKLLHVFESFPIVNSTVAV